MDPSPSSSKWPSNPNDDSRHAFIHIQPSVRQTVVTTTTTTTIHHAPVRVPRPASPILSGNYAEDRRRYPLHFAVNDNAAQYRNAKLDVEQSSTSTSNAASNAPDAFSISKQFDFRIVGEGQNPSNAIKATYSAQSTLAVPAQPNLANSGASILDPKGKKRMRPEDEARLFSNSPRGPDSPRPSILQSSPASHVTPGSSLIVRPLKRPRQTSDDGLALTDFEARSIHKPFSIQPPSSMLHTPDNSFFLEDRIRKSSPNADNPHLLQHLTTYEDHEQSVSGGVLTAPHTEAVLPSPNLSPRISASELESQESELIPLISSHHDAFVAGETSSSDAVLRSHVYPPAHEQVIETTETTTTDLEQIPETLMKSREMAVILSLPSLVQEFAALPSSTQFHVFSQLLKHVPVGVLQHVNALLTPALKRDFITDLPPELAALILSQLDFRDVLSCTLVSHSWRGCINGQGRLWANLLKRDRLWVGDSDPEKTEDAEAASLSRHGARNLRTGAERSIRELLAMQDHQSQAFLQRWKHGVWDHSLSLKTAAVPANIKIAAARAAVPRPSGAAGPNMPDVKPDRLVRKLRRSTTKLYNSEGGSRPMPASPTLGNEAPMQILPIHSTLTTSQNSRKRSSDYVHPLKLLYKKRKAIAHHWARPAPPRRVTVAAGHSSVVTCLQFDNSKLVSASDDPFIDVYDIVTGERTSRLHGHEGGVWALQYIGNVLVSGSTDRTLRIWDLTTGLCTHVFTGHTSTVRCLQIVEPVNVNPDINGPPVWEPPYPLIVTGSRDWTLRVWKLPNPKQTMRESYAPPSPSEVDRPCGPRENPFHLLLLKGHSLAVRALAAHGRTLVSGSYDFTLRIWDLLSGTCRSVLRGHQQKVYSVTLDHVRKRCASGSMDGSVRIWSIETGEQLLRLDGHSSLVGLLGLSYHFLVSAGADSTLKVWDPVAGTCIDTLQANAGAITCFKHDDFRVVSGADGQLRIWDIRRGVVIRDVLENMNNVWQVNMGDRFCVAAVQRDGISELEIFDFFPELRTPADGTDENDFDDTAEDAVSEAGAVDEHFPPAAPNTPAGIKPLTAGKFDVVSQHSTSGIPLPPVPSAPELRSLPFPSLHDEPSDFGGTSFGAVGLMSAVKVEPEVDVDEVKNEAYHTDIEDFQVSAHHSPGSSALTDIESEMAELDDSAVTASDIDDVFSASAGEEADRASSSDLDLDALVVAGLAGESSTGRHPPLVLTLESAANQAFSSASMEDTAKGEDEEEAFTFAAVAAGTSDPTV